MRSQQAGALTDLLATKGTSPMQKFAAPIGFVALATEEVIVNFTTVNQKENPWLT